MTVEGRRATGAHVSINGHITRAELLRLLQDTDAANGFGNRILWYCARRSRLLPDGGGRPDLSDLAGRLTAASEFSKQTGELHRDEAASRLWHEVYPALSEGRPGLLGAILGRAEPQVMRIAVIYGVLDQSRVVRAEHLRGGLAVWRYCEDSARFIFGDALGDPAADTLLDALRANPDGLTREQISVVVFGRHKPSGEISRALGWLLDQNLVTVERRDTGGRPAEAWRATMTRIDPAKEAK